MSFILWFGGPCEILYLSRIVNMWATAFNSGDANPNRKTWFPPGDCRQICHLVLNSQRPPSLDARFGDFYLQVNSSPQLDSGLLLSLDIYILDGNMVWRSTTTAVNKQWCLLPSLLNRSSCNMIKVIVLWWPGTRVFRINICGFSKFASSRTKGVLWEITCLFLFLIHLVSLLFLSV